MVSAWVKQMVMVNPGGFKPFLTNPHNFDTCVQQSYPRSKKSWYTKSQACVWNLIGLIVLAHGPFFVVPAEHRQPHQSTASARSQLPPAQDIYVQSSSGAIQAPQDEASERLRLLSEPIRMKHVNKRARMGCIALKVNCGGNHQVGYQLSEDGGHKQREHHLTNRKQNQASSATYPDAPIRRNYSRSVVASLMARKFAGHQRVCDWQALYRRPIACVARGSAPLPRLPNGETFHTRFQNGGWRSTSGNGILGHIGNTIKNDHRLGKHMMHKSISTRNNIK